MVPYDAERYLYDHYVDGLGLGFYFFKVAQVDRAGNESACQAEEIWIDAYPAPPESVAADYDDGTHKVTLGWTASGDL